jgi:hypothetical protein
MKYLTAIYNGLHNTKFGGRLNRDKHYLFSLKCLSKLGADIICYTSNKDKTDIENFLVSRNITNVELRVFELKDFVHHNKIQQIKEFNKDLYATDNVWEHRCVELMWLKIFWLYQESLENPEDTFLWIDAGISHDGIFPKKCNTVYNSDYEQTFQKDKIFTPKLTNKLCEMASDHIVAFYCNNRQHHYPHAYYARPLLPGSMVAGLFGGKFKSISEVYNKSIAIIDNILANNMLLQEELILTLIYQDNPEIFNVVPFDTWYHDDWDCYDPTHISFSKFFEDANQ